MKPLSVLLLVLVAVGVLFFAISNLPSKKDPGTGVGVEPLANSPEAPVDAGSDAALPGADTGGRDAVAVAPTQAPERSSGTAGNKWDNQLVGRIENPEGKPVAGAQVVLTRSSSAASFFVNTELDRSGDRQLRTGSDGRFSFEQVEPYDHYAIEVYHEDYSSTELVPVSVGMEGVFEEGPIVLAKGATLKGFVRAQDGGGVGGAQLYLDSMFFQASEEPNPARLSVTSDSFGAFEFKNVAAGHRSLLVEAEGFAHALINGLNFRAQDVVERDVTLDVAEMICGRVVGPGNEPVAEAQVQALSFSNSGQQCREITSTDADGTFCLSSIAPGKYLVAVHADGYMPANQRQVQAGDTNVLLEMKTQATVTGKVVDAATGAAVTKFSCSLRQTFEGIAQTTPTSINGDFEDAEGNFELAGVSPGSFLVEARADGYAPGFSESFTINQGQGATGILVRLGQGGKIVGIVVDSSGVPVARAKISTKPNDWTGSEFDLVMDDMIPSNITKAEAITDSTGAFTLSNLRPETYQIRIQGPNVCELVMVNVVVPDSGEKDLGTIPMLAGGTIRGKVFDQAGRPAGNARISLRIDASGGESPRFYNAKANASGEFEFKTVYPGNYEIQAQPARSATGEEIFDVLTAGVASRPVSAVDGRVVTVELKLGS